MPSIAALVLMMMATQAGPGAGEVVGTFGSVIVQRGDESVPLWAGSQLLAGDRIITAAESGAAIRTNPQTALYVGAQSRIVLSADVQSDRMVLLVNPGEVRVTPSAGRSVEVRTPLAAGICQARSTIRCKAQTDVVRYWAETGSSRITLTDAAVAAKSNTAMKLVSFLKVPRQTEIVLREGEMVEIRRGEGFGEIEPGDPDQWTIRLTEFAIAMAGGRGSRLQGAADIDPVTTPSPDQFSPQGQVPGERSGKNSQVSLTGGFNATLGTSIVSSAAGSAGGASVDADQGTLSGKLQSGVGSVFAGSAFPGNIHLVTGETSYTFTDIRLEANDLFPTTTQYWSLGVGPVPQGQIVTDVLTGTDPSPTVVPIPQFEAYIVRLDQFASPDPSQGGSSSTTTLGVTGLLGENPVGPGVSGATPLADERARMNQTATFALGEFAVRRDGDAPVISMRRSDQDRRIVKDAGGNDDHDAVTVNPDIAQFNTTVDPRFFAPDKAVFVPANNALRNLPRYSRSELIRKAGFTVLTAETLQGFARRTGQTRFVVDGQVVDITGYRP